MITVQQRHERAIAVAPHAPASAALSVFAMVDPTG